MLTGVACLIVMGPGRPIDVEEAGLDRFDLHPTGMETGGFDGTGERSIVLCVAREIEYQLVAVLWRLFLGFLICSQERTERMCR